MMRWMKEIYPGMGFDCASVREIHDVLPITSVQSIIYAQPCKKREDVMTARDLGIPRTVVDSAEEMKKLEGWEGEILVRLLVSDKGSKQPFGKKFGAPLPWLGQIYEIAKTMNLKMSGFSFHVGSECQAPQQYADAIEDCRKAQKIAEQYGFDTSVVDIGGGFLSEEEPFVAVANQIKIAQAKHFPDPAVSWIAEPGRFLAAPTHTLYTTVIGKKPVWPAPLNDSEPTWRITIDESVYGSFSNIPFDHQKPVLERMRIPGPDEKQKTTVVFGRTCDSGDCLGDVLLHEVEEGDVLRVRNMGAYTTVTASEFNGFPKPAAVYELK